MRQLQGCHRRVTCLCGGLALAAVAALAGCESEVFGTLSANPVETSQGSLQPGADPAAESAEPGSITEGNPMLGGLASEPELPPRTCDGVPVVCRSPVATADSLPGRQLPPVQTHLTETISLQRIFEKFDAACGRCHAPPELPGPKNGNWVVAGA